MSKSVQPGLSPLQFLSHIKGRGLVHDETPKLEVYLKSCSEKGESPACYTGFDPSAISLQVGNMVAILMLRRAQLFGIRPIALLGGATGLVGDPSGKKSERTLMEKETVRENVVHIKKQIANLVDTSAGKFRLEFVNNYDWFKGVEYLDFLRDVGKHISINYMLAKESVKLRMETGISYAEFGYMLIQGYDFMQLYEREDCRIQLGGSDQWGNMTTGIELVRRKHQGEVHSLSIPLLTDSAGNKLGKTETGALFLDPGLTSPYQFYQYWLNLPDDKTPQVLRALTLLTDEYIEELEAGIASAPEKRQAQKILAHDITGAVHGQEVALAVESASKVLFSKDPKSLENLDPKALDVLSREVPSSSFDANDSIGIIDLLVRIGLSKSKGEARRQIKGNSISLNRYKVTDEQLTISKSQFQNNPFLLVGMGKSKLHLLLLNS